METVVQGHYGRIEVEFVRGNDRNEVHAFAFGKCSFVLDHLLVGVVDPVVGKKVGASRTSRYVWIYAKASAYEFDLVFHQGGSSVYGADKGIATSSDHTHSQFSVHILRF